jgi:GT2 family glycosyltransferase
MSAVDVIVVSYNSADYLRGCVEPLSAVPGYTVIVIDNASKDASLDTVSDLPIKAVALQQNGGFAYANNVGLRHGNAEHVLFVNPDARIRPEAVERLAGILDQSERVGAVGPRIIDQGGTLDFSQRRFPRITSTFARALFLHHVFPTSGWTDDLIRDERAYQSAHAVDWISGACILARRDVVTTIGGWDESYFHYGEDIDLCRMIWDAGYEVQFEPGAEALHVGGASADRRDLAPLLARSRIRYMRKHRGEGAAMLVRAGVALEAVARIVAGRGGWNARAGHARALKVAVSPIPRAPVLPH